jgi:hypothetical protein
MNETGRRDISSSRVSGTGRARERGRAGPTTHLHRFVRDGLVEALLDPVHHGHLGSGRALSGSSAATRERLREDEARPRARANVSAVSTSRRAAREKRVVRRENRGGCALARNPDARARATRTGREGADVVPRREVCAGPRRGRSIRRGSSGLKTVRHAGGEEKRVRKVGPAVQGSLFTGNICSTERFGVRQTVKKRNRPEWMLFPE